MKTTEGLLHRSLASNEPAYPTVGVTISSSAVIVSSVASITCPVHEHMVRTERIAAHMLVRLFIGFVIKAAVPHGRAAVQF